MWSRTHVSLSLCLNVYAKLASVDVINSPFIKREHIQTLQEKSAVGLTFMRRLMFSRQVRVKKQNNWVEKKKKKKRWISRQQIFSLSPVDTPLHALLSIYSSCRLLTSFASETHYYYYFFFFRFKKLLLSNNHPSPRDNIPASGKKNLIYFSLELNTYQVVVFVHAGVVPF